MDVPVTVMAPTLPEWITEDMFKASVAKVALKDAPASLSKVRLQTLAEGTCVQTLHVGSFDDEAPVLDVSGNRSLILFDRGDEVVVTAGPEGVRFLLVSGQPLAEPVAWHGPIVMNTQGEIRRALQDLRDGTFIR